MGEWLYVNPAHREALERAGMTDFDAWMLAPCEEERDSDRGETLAIVDAGDRHAYLKRYRAVGFGARFFARKSRVRREAENAMFLRSIGVPAAEVMAAGERRRGGRPVAAFIATREIAGARPLTQIASRPAARDARALVESLARAVRRMHDAGYAAHDLYARNVLVARGESGAIEAWLIDHPRGGRPRLFRRRAHARDLACLARDLPAWVTRADRLRFIRYYLGDARLGRRGAMLMCAASSEVSGRRSREA